MTDILAIDIATNCGFARGIVGGVPTCGSLRFGAVNASNNAVFGHALKWISKLLEPQPRPDILIMEAMLPPQARVGHTSRDVRDRLAGLHGIIRGVAYLRGIGEIAEANVGDVRMHFICDRHMPRSSAKSQVMRQCEMMDWHPKNDNEGDALALWSYACGIVDPKTALKVVPMFMRRRA